jgi:hypothetical protein
MKIQKGLYALVVSNLLRGNLEGRDPQPVITPLANKKGAQATNDSNLKSASCLKLHCDVIT